MSEKEHEEMIELLNKIRMNTVWLSIVVTIHFLLVICLLLNIPLGLSAWWGSIVNPEVDYSAISLACPPEPGPVVK